MASDTQQILRYIARAYYRLFYFFFRIEKRNDGDDKGSDAYCAFMALLPLIYFGFIALMFIKYLFSRFIYNWHIMQSKTFAISIVLISTIFNVVLFFHKKRYLKIKEMFSKEDDDTRQTRSFLCILFSLFTMFGSVIIIAIFGLPK